MALADFGVQGVRHRDGAPVQHREINLEYWNGLEM